MVGRSEPHEVGLADRGAGGEVVTRLRDPINYSQILQDSEGSVRVGGKFLNGQLLAMGVTTVLISGEAERVVGTPVDLEKLERLKDFHRENLDLTPNAKKVDDIDLQLIICIGDRPEGESVDLEDGVGIVDGLIWMSVSEYEKSQTAGTDPTWMVLHRLEERMAKGVGLSVWEMDRSCQIKTIGNGDSQMLIGDQVFAQGDFSYKNSDKLVAEVHPLLVRVDQGETVTEALVRVGHVPTTAAALLNPDGGVVWASTIMPTDWDGVDRARPVSDPWSADLTPKDTFDAYGEIFSQLRLGLKAVMDYCLQNEGVRGGKEALIALVQNRLEGHNFIQLPYAPWTPWEGGEPGMRRSLGILERMVDCLVVDPQAASEIFIKGRLYEKLFGITGDAIKQQLEGMLRAQYADLTNESTLETQRAWFSQTQRYDGRVGYTTDEIIDHNRTVVKSCGELIELVGKVDF